MVSILFIVILSFGIFSNIVGVLKILTFQTVHCVPGGSLLNVSIDPFTQQSFNIQVC